MNELTRIYAEWREQTEEEGGSVDCGREDVRKDFSAYAELESEIEFETMLALERNY